MKTAQLEADLGNGNGSLTVRPSEGIGVRAEQSRVQAEIQSRLMVAKSCPRNEAEAVDRIMNACQRPGLAEKAEYVYDRGGQEVSGATIDILQVIATNWGNIDFGFRELSQGNCESSVECYAWDLETNSREVRLITIPHKRYKKGVGLTPLVDPRDVYEMVANNAQRRVRACLEAVIPPDIVEDAIFQCRQTLETTAKVDDESIARLLEAFTKFSVTRDQIQKRIGRRLESMQPAQLVQLRKIWKSLSDGMSEVTDWFQPIDSVADPEQPRTATESAKAAMKAQKATAPKKPETKPEEPDNDPFKPSDRESGATSSATRNATSEEGRTEPPAEVVKTTPKATPKGHAVEKPATKTADPAKKSGPTAEALRGFINLNYQDNPDVPDFDTEKIIQDCVGISDWRKIIDAIISRKHPEFSDYLKAELQTSREHIEPDSGEKKTVEDVSQEGSDDDGANQDVPEFITNPVPRPTMRDDAIEAEEEIIGKRNFGLIRSFLNARVAGNNNPFFNESEQAYLLSLGNRRAYQLEHDLPRTDKLPK